MPNEAMTPQDKAAPGLEEQIAYIGESIDGECGCFMCRHNRAILASLEELQRIRDEYRYKPKMAPSQARESERQGEAPSSEFCEPTESAVRRLCNRLNSDDPDFDDCSEAARWLRYLADREETLLKRCAAYALSVSGAEKAEWVPWKLADALPEGELFITTVHGFGYRAAFVSMTTPKGFEESGVLAYWSIPLPPPYQAIKAGGTGNE